MGERNLCNGGTVYRISAEDFASMPWESREKLGQLGRYHGIFAMASLFHLERDSIFGVLQKLFDSSLESFGCVLSTLPCRDQNSRGVDGRWHSGFTADRQEQLFSKLSRHSIVDIQRFEVLAKHEVSIYNG